MSAVRRNDRRSTRNHLSSPYKRPSAQPKKSGWSLSGLFSLLNPLRSRTPEESDEHESSEDAEEGEDDVGEDARDASIQESDYKPLAPPEVLSQRGRELAQGPSGDPFHQSFSSPTNASRDLHSIFGSPSTPLMNRREDTAPSLSPRQNLEVVKQFLQDRTDDKPLNSVEYTGLIALLQGSVEDEVQPEPFRFSPTPSRGATPAFNMGSAGPSVDSTASQIPHRTLSKNPNGVYKWQGGGSARPRNRFQSPAFGPPRPSPSKMKLSPPKSPKKTDTKRRRVGLDSEMSTPQRANVPAPSPSPSRAQPHAGPSTPPVTGSSQSKSNGATTNGHISSKSAVPSTPRLRVSVTPKPTTPAVPSPLRNTWGMNDQSPSQSSQPPKQPTRAANFMSELIKEVTPPKRPDVSNPYQTASPVKVPAAKKPTRKRKVPEEEKPREKELNLSPQRIIEATVPKGSQRARPPPNLERKTSSAKTNGILSGEPPRRSARLKSPSPPRTISSSLNGASAKGDEAGVSRQPSLKKQKTAPNGRISEDVETHDVDMFASSTQSATRPTESVEPSEPTTAPAEMKASAFATFGSNSSVFGSPSKVFPPKSSAPKEPSKLRFGFAADAEEDVSPAPAPTTASTSPFGSSTSPFDGSASAFGSEAAIGGWARSFGVPAFGSEAASPFSFSSGASAFSSSSSSVRPASFDSVLASSPTPVPPKPTTTFAAELPPTVKATSSVFGATKADPKDAAKAVDTPTLPTFSFTVPLRSTLCPAEYSKERNAAKAIAVTALPSFLFLFQTTEKGDSAKAASTSSPAPVASGFDWAAAGMKPPTKAAGAAWTCGTCMLSNPDTAVECTVCEAPRP